jgi:hypothetical protein
MAGNMYIPPTQNPFLQQSMGLLQNIGLMYLGHNLKQQDQEKQQAYQEEQRQRELDTKLVLAGYKPVTPEQQMGDVGNGPPAANQVSIKGLGNYLTPSNEPKIFTAGGATFIADKEGKLTQVKTPGSDKLPSPEMQAFAKWQETNPGGTYEKFAPWYKNLTEKAPVVQLSIDQKGESAATTAYGSGIGKAAEVRDQVAEQAFNQNIDLDQMAQAIKQGSQTGWGEQSMLNFKEAAQTVGQKTGWWDVKDLSGQELIRRTSNVMAMQARNPQGGLGLPGNISNKDLEFLTNSVPGLAISEQGNLKIIDSMKKVNTLKVAIAKEQAKIIKEHKGVVPTDMNSRLMEFAQNYKVFNDSDKKDMERLSKPIINTGRDKKSGRPTIQFADGTWDYANAN